MIQAPDFPLEPLATAAGIELGRTGGHRPGEHASGVAAMAERVGVSESTIKRARRNGLSEAQADAWAVALGFLPLDVWPEAWGATYALAGLWWTARANATKTTCPQGHPYDGTDARGARTCSTCNRARVHRSRWRKKSKNRTDMHVDTLITGDQLPLFRVGDP